MCLQGKAQGFNIWLSKQCSGFCGTRVQVGYYSGDTHADVACPNCGEREDDAHLCQCPDEDRTKLLQDNTDDLESWMNKGGETNCDIGWRARIR